MLLPLHFFVLSLFLAFFLISACYPIHVLFVNNREPEAKDHVEIFGSKTNRGMRRKGKKRTVGRSWLLWSLCALCSSPFPFLISLSFSFNFSPLTDPGLCPFVRRLVFIVVSSSNHFRPGRRAIVISTCANLVVPACVPDIRVHRPS